MKTDNNKLYTLKVDTVAGSNANFKHYRLSLGNTYSGEYFSYSGCHVNFQSNINKSYDTDTLLPYAGEIQCRLENSEQLAVIVKAMKKGKLLNPTGQNEWDNLIIGLRQLGYKQANIDSYNAMSTDINHID